MKIALGSGRRDRWVSPLAALALSAAIVSGCGSAEDEGAAPPAVATPSASTGAGNGTAQESEAIGRGGRGHGATSRGGGAESSRHGAKRAVAGPTPPHNAQGQVGAGADRGSSGSPHSGVDGAREGGTRVASSNSGRCPSGVSRAECEGIAEQVGETPSTSVSSPEDCVKAIGREACERLLEVESAAKGGPSIDIKDCLERPTPRCEAALAPILEAERTASNSQR